METLYLFGIRRRTKQQLMWWCLLLLILSSSSLLCQVLNAQSKLPAASVSGGANRPSPNAKPPPPPPPLPVAKPKAKPSSVVVKKQGVQTSTTTTVQTSSKAQSAGVMILTVVLASLLFSCICCLLIVNQVVKKRRTKRQDDFDYKTSAASALTSVPVAFPSNDPVFPPPQAASGKVRKVVSVYTPSLGDEMELRISDKITVLVEYDDGWCQGINHSRGGAKGVFPRHCLEP